MSVEEFLKKCNNSELCALLYYKKDSYLPSNQEKIFKELTERGISEADIPAVIENIKSNKPKRDERICPRCYSSKIEPKKNINYNTGYRTGLDGFVGKNDEITYEECLICGYKYYHKLSLRLSQALRNATFTLFQRLKLILFR